MRTHTNHPAILVVSAVVCFGAAAAAAAQTAQPSATRRAEDVFKDVRILRGIPVDQFMDTMGMFSAATGLNCTNCHAAGNSTTWDNYAVDTRLKDRARAMLAMVNAINREHFNGAPAITCYTCHHGDQRPKGVPSLLIQYSPPVEDPNEIEAFGARGLPSANLVFANYLRALGGLERVAQLTSFSAKGTYSGFDTEQAKVPVEIYARAPAARTVIVHAPFGDSVRVFDGTRGWIASADRPLPLMPLTGGNLSGARLDALFSFPARLESAFSDWRVGATTIEDRDMQVLQGRNRGEPPVNLYFDVESALIRRAVRFSDTLVGRLPTQIDYADYRDVAGVKIPFRWTITWTNGQSTIEVVEVQANAPIDASRFAMPAPAAPIK